MAAALQNLVDRGEIWLAEKQAGEQISPKPSLGQSQGQDQRQHANFAQFKNYQIDSDLPHGGLPAGAVHEWFLKTHAGAIFSSSKRAPKVPHTIINTLAANFFKETIALNQKSNEVKRFILWIGKSVWPTPFLLDQVLGQKFFENCVFIDPPQGKLLLWAIETALRSPATVVTIASCANLSFATSKRLSIAAQRGGGLGLLVRDIAELSKPTMVFSRWLLESVSSKTEEPEWQLSLLKYRGGIAKQSQWLI